MSGSIENKTLRELVEDRDRALAAKEKEIAGLKEQVKSLEGELTEAWKHPLSGDEVKAKAALSDYEATAELMVGRMRRPLGGLRLFDVVRNAVVALDNTRDERDRYKSAFDSLQNAAKRTKDIAEGGS